MNQKTYSVVTGTIFLIIGLVHLMRAIMGWPVMMGAVSIPVWVSWFGIIIAGYLAYQGLTKKSSSL